MHIQANEHRQKKTGKIFVHTDPIKRSYEIPEIPPKTKEDKNNTMQKALVCKASISWGNRIVASLRIRKRMSWRTTKLGRNGQHW